MKFLEAQGVPRKNIIDGRVFQVQNLDFPRLLAEGVAYGIMSGTSLFEKRALTIYKQIYQSQDSRISLKIGTKSYINYYANIAGTGSLDIGNFSCIGREIKFRLNANGNHNYKNVSLYDSAIYDWIAPRQFFSKGGICQINIGNDVWIGSGSILKSTNPARPLTIGDGAVIASDSVVVKNVPPYAIVGGNPARLIKYRFSEDIIAALLRIRWWDWDIDKIYENFKYFNRVEEFVARHDKGV